MSDEHLGFRKFDMKIVFDGMTLDQIRELKAFWLSAHTELPCKEHKPNTVYVTLTNNVHEGTCVNCGKAVVATGWRLK